MAKKDRLARKAKAQQDNAAAEKYLLDKAAAEQKNLYDKAVNKEVAYQKEFGEPSSRAIPTTTTTTEEVITPNETVVTEQVDETGRMSKRKQKKAIEAQNNAAAQKYLLDKNIAEQKSLYDKAVNKEVAYQKEFGEPSSRADERNAIREAELKRIGETNVPPITEDSGPTILGSETNAALDFKSAINSIDDANKKIEGEAAIAKLEAGGDSQIVKSINQAEQELKAANSSVADETMKNALGVDSPISPAIAKTLEESKTTGNPIEVTTEDIRKVNDAINSEDYYSMSPEEQRQLEAYSKILNDPKTKVRKSEPALEKLGVQDYYPDMNQGIQEGSYSGSIVGSIPIYTAKGGVLPIGVFDARKRAVEAAAVEAKKQKADLIELAKVKTAPQYQQAADNLAFAAMDKYLNLAGGDASVLMDATNPIGKQFQRELNKVNNIKQEADWLEKRGQELLKAINDEKMYVPNESKDVLKQWLSGNYSMEELMTNPKALKEFHNIYNKLKINDNETYVIGQNFTKWKNDIVPIVADWNARIEALPAEKYNELMAIKAGKDNDAYLQVAMKYMPNTRLEVLAKELYKTGEFTMGETEFFTYLQSWFNKEIVPKIDIRANQNQRRAEFRYQKEKDQQDKIFENLKINTLNVDNQNAILKAAQSGDNTFLFNTIKKLNGWGDVRENNNRVLVQTIDTKPMQGKESFTTFADANKILIGGKWQTPQEVKNKYKSYSKYLVDDVVDGKVVGKKLSTTLMQLDNVAVPKTQEEINLIKYGSATGWSDNMQFDTKVEKGNTYRAYPDPETGKLIPMTAEDYKDEIKVKNSRPMVTIYESSGKKTESGFAPTFTSVKIVDLTNTTSTAGLDAFYIKENVPYSAAFDITDTGTPSDDDAVGGDAGNSAAAGAIIDFSGDTVE